MASSPQNRSWWLGFLDKTHFTVTATTAFVCLYTRSAGVVYFSAGALSTSLSAKVIKKIIRQPRPVSPQSHKKTYGMPSTHSAAITFYAVYIALACAYLPVHHTLAPLSPAIRLIPLVVTPWAATIVASRVWLGHHTWEQVAGGCAWGVVVSTFWFEAWVRGGSTYGHMLEQALNPYIRW